MHDAHPRPHAPAPGSAVELLAASPPFAGVPVAQIAEFIDEACEEMELGVGDDLVREGDAPDAFYLLLEGRLDVRRTSERGREFSLATLDAVQTVGEFALFDRAPRSATLRALEPCRLYRIPLDRMEGTRSGSTDMERNWFIWLGIAGHYNHDLPDAVPPYLRAEYHERARVAPTEVSFHLRNLFDLLGEAPAETWTHYSLCDAIDWMTEPVQRHLLSEVIRTAAPGGRLLYRTTENTSFVRKLGLDHRLRLLEDASERASADERSCLYRRVNVYEVVK